MMGIDALDRKILKAIENRPQSATDLANRLAMNRATIRYRLARLKRLREVSTKKGERRRVLWVLKAKMLPKHGKVLVLDRADFGQMPFLIRKTRGGSILYNIIGTDALRHISHLPRSYVLDCQRMIKRKRLVIIRDTRMSGIVYEILGLLFDTLEVATPTRVVDFQKHIDTILAHRAHSHTVER